MLTFRQRSLLVAWILAGLAFMAVAWTIVVTTTAQSPLGPKKQINTPNYFGAAPSTDGERVFFLEGRMDQGPDDSDWWIKSYDLETHRSVRWRVVDPELGPALGRGVSHVAERGTFLFGANKLFDLTTGTVQSLDWNDVEFRIGARHGDLVYGGALSFSGFQIRALSDPGRVIEQRDVGANCVIIPLKATATHLLFTSCHATAPLGFDVFDLRTGVRQSLPVQEPGEHTLDTRSGTTIDLTDTHIYAVVQAMQGDPVLRIYDLADLNRFHDVALDLPRAAAISDLSASQDRWVVQYSAPNPDSFFEPILGLKYGRSDGRIEAGADLTDNHYAFGVLLSAFPIRDHLVYESDGIVILSTPGAFSFPPLALASAAVLLAGAAIAFPIVRRRWLGKVAGGGLVRCLNCGKKRERGIAFCPFCAWRSDPEEAEANKKKEAWQHDWD